MPSRIERALVSGASARLGAEFARLLADRDATPSGVSRRARRFVRERSTA